MLEVLGEAFDRIDDFLAIQHVGRRVGRDEMIDALHCLQASVGLGEDERSLLRERIDAVARVSGPGGKPGQVHVGEVVLGLIVGLTAAQLGTERPQRSDE